MRNELEKVWKEGRKEVSKPNNQTNYRLFCIFCTQDFPHMRYYVLSLWMPTAHHTYAQQTQPCYNFPFQLVNSHMSYAVCNIIQRNKLCIKVKSFQFSVESFSFENELISSPINCKVNMSFWMAKSQKDTN